MHTREHQGFEKKTKHFYGASLLLSGIKFLFDVKHSPRIIIALITTNS